MAVNAAIKIALIAPGAIVAITLQEAAHGYVARYFGDDTAALRGRVTLNPLKHIDLVGTILLPAILVILNTGFIFGYAKPVPVNPNALFHPKRDMVWVAAAGPATNVILALLSFLLIFPARLTGHAVSYWLVPILLDSIITNLLLAILNMIPLPPLDGGKVAVGLLPKAIAIPLAKLGRYGFLILVGAIVILPPLGKKIGIDLNIFDWLVVPPIRFVMAFVHAILSHH
jgi:Zn-dependent protease